jgi:hypothetical protein
MTNYALRKQKKRDDKCIVLRDTVERKSPSFLPISDKARSPFGAEEVSQQRAVLGGPLEGLRERYFR